MTHNKQFYKLIKQTTMKKLLFVALAAVGMTACVQNEELAVAGGDVAIAFENAYVYNATKADPSTTAESITGFTTWAFMDEVGGTVLTAEDVTKNGGVWGYTNIQYWAPNHTYYFAALSPIAGHWTATATQDLTASKLGLGVVAFENVDGTEDLLYAKTIAETPNRETLATNGMKKVTFNFQHLLSKVRFSFKNGFTTENMSVYVTNVKMTAPATAEIDLAVADYSKGWKNLAGELTLNFGDVESVLEANKPAIAAADDRLTIPAGTSQEYTVTFDVVVMSGSVVAMEAKDMKTTIKGYELQMGCAYNFVAAITPESLVLKAIEFDAPIVTPWDENHNMHDVAAGYYVSTRDELQSALNAISGVTRNATPVAAHNIYLANNIEGNVIVDQLPGISYVIDGCGYKYDGTIEIYGHARHDGDETLVIKNVNFEHASGAIDFITCNTAESEKRYAHNVTVKDCTFKGDLDAVGMRFRQCFNIVAEGCTATGMHSLFQGTGGNGYTVKGATISGGKNGISFGTSTNVAVLNSNITATGYGVRVDGSVNTTLAIEDNTIAAALPVVVRKLTGKYNVALAGVNTLTTDGEYQIVLTNGADDAEWVKPTGKYTITGAENMNVYPVSTVANDATSLEAALAAEDTKTVYLAAGEYTMPAGSKFSAETVLVCAEGTVFTGNSKLNINGATVVGATFSNPSGSAVDQTINGTFKGCTFTGSNALRYTYAGATCVFEDCVFSGSVYGIHFDGGANDVIFRNCTISGFNGLGAELTMVTFEGCTFVGNGKSGYNGANLWGSAKLINCEFTFNGTTGNEWIDCIGADKTYEFENCTVNGVALTATNIAESGIFSRNKVIVKLNGVDCQL